ncbi:O-6-methylguanine DNA methyltransferase [Desulfuromonas soudanensis]|uniref:methylated-DNA--[protein]-cysteine S-methyltransferase n=1 Tax=Desulfuromonas soudanensis TaxID=1603606 RepID=A0A0M5INB9_9BACT|nr:methylated-DNA--[protein]-cysteine S-methyltransferase [Desulfuromonas soudanensis]ALC16686.1 O-6-methylguanine DNA methyltransferase [Desulfuromonas soudanensis]
MLKRPQKGGSFDLWSSPIGWIGAVARDGLLVALFIHPDSHEIRERISRYFPGALPGEDRILGEVRHQLDEYFHHQRRVFDLPLDFTGIPTFTALVLRNLSLVPHGETITYGDLAKEIGRPLAARAVGGALAANPFPIVLPCHRVVGAKGRLTGYSGGEGVVTKKWLLEFEGKRS